MATPLFSVVIPLFNKAPYIARAIRSVLSQSFDNYEIVVVDDGSTDGGGLVAKETGGERIRMLAQENRGASAARKAGVSSATGHYVAFLDADDEWHADFLAEISSLIGEYPDCGMYASGYRIIEPDGRVLTIRNRYEREEWRGRVHSYFRNLAGGNLIVCSSAVAIPRALLGDEGFLEGLDVMGEDQYLWATIALQHKVAYTQKLLAVYHRDVMGYFATIGPLKEAPCYVSLLSEVVRTGRFRGVAIVPETLGQIRRYIAESLLQNAILNARAGDQQTALAFLADDMTRAKLIRRTVVMGYARVTTLAAFLRPRSRKAVEEGPLHG